MSTQQHKSSIAEYKRKAFLKYCNENSIEKYKLKKLSILNKHQKLGLFYCFMFYNKTSLLRR